MASAAAIAPLLRGVAKRSSGAIAAALANAVNGAHRSFAGHDTAQFGPRNGNYRVDYVLPSVGLPVRDAGVFWPAPGEPGAEWLDASDHRMVWVDLESGNPSEVSATRP